MSSDGRNLNVEFSLVEEELLAKIREDFPNYTEGVVRGNPGDFLLSPGYAREAENIYNFQVRSDDVWVVTFPKCGTTWTQELVWLMANNCNFEEAKAKNLEMRFPFMELALLAPQDLFVKMAASSKETGTNGNHLEGMANHFPTLDSIAAAPSPRFIKTHLPFYLLPPNLLDTAKVVYVARNPKDVIVSYYYHHKLIKFHNFSKSLEEFAEYFIKDQVLYSPFFPHIFEAWNKRHHPNILFLFYEDMKADLAGQLRKVGDFLNKPISEENLVKLVEHLRFDNFAKNESVNNEMGKKMGFMNKEGNFIRKGKTGDWKNHFSPELNARIDEWISENMQNRDLKFTTQLDKQD